MDWTLAWFVREPWPSPSTGAAMASGTVSDAAVTVHVEFDSLIVLGDGIESDRLTLAWGQYLTIAPADRRLATVQ